MIRKYGSNSYIKKRHFESFSSSGPWPTEAFIVPSDTRDINILSRTSFLSWRRKFGVMPYKNGSRSSLPRSMMSPSSSSSSSCWNLSVKAIGFFVLSTSRSFISRFIESALWSCSDFSRCSRAFFSSGRYSLEEVSYPYLRIKGIANDIKLFIFFSRTLNCGNKFLEPFSCITWHADSLKIVQKCNRRECRWTTFKFL